MEKRELKKFLIIGLIVIGVCLVVKNFSFIASIIRLIISAASPLVMGCAIAYIFNILLSFCEKFYFPSKKTGFAAYSRRPVCLVITFALVITIISVIANVVVPELITALKLISSEIPGAAMKVRDFAVEYLKDFPDMQEKIAEMDFDWNAIAENVFGFITVGAGGLISSIAGFIGEFTVSVVNFVIALIFAVYLLLRKDRIQADIRRTKNVYLSEKTNKRLSKVYHIANDTFKSFFIGQFVEAIILGSLCMIGMTILGFPYAAMTGTVIGVTALIPIVGAYFGAAVGAFMICTVDPMKALGFLVFLVILQQVEGNLIYPKVVGSSVGLPGIWVLAAVTVGGSLCGVTGMLLGVPIAASAYKIYHEVLRNKEKKMGIEAPEESKPKTEKKKIFVKEKKNKAAVKTQNKK